MHIHSVKLVNFKSLGDYPENEIILEPRVTSVIGKNESGKSNVLEGLSLVRFRGRYSDAFNANYVNRNCPVGTENKYVITLKPTIEEIAYGLAEDTIIEIFKDGYSATGGMLTYYLRTIQPDVDTLLSTLGPLGANPLQLRDGDWANYKTYYNELCNQQQIDVPRRTAGFKLIQQNAGKIAAEKKELLNQTIETVQEKWQTLVSFLPTLFYRKGDRHLNSTYKYEDIEKELKTPNAYPNSLLNAFVKVIGVTADDFLLASRSGMTGQQEKLRRQINKLTNERINQKFSDFYQTEHIYLDISFNSGAIAFIVQSNDGSPLMLSERSNGLRWYLETFIDAQANDVSGRNVVYLFDEPGTSLHVNAQRELLKLFGHLSDMGNQVVYTTHSPYMLNLEEEGIHRIRAVVKDIDGNTHVYKTAYDARIAPDSQQDTLAPIISALGMSLGDTFGPAKDKINIVTEGMSDYIFLITMAKQLNVDINRYAIIPAVGATNCVKICSILHGWGCKYIALFDYDNEGVENGGEYMTKEMLFECGKQYLYVKDVSVSEIQSKTYSLATGKYMIEDVMLRSEIDRYCNETGTSKELGKPLTAKLMCTAIENSTFTVAQQSKDNFNSLFERIFSAFR